MVALYRRRAVSASLPVSGTMRCVGTDGGYRSLPLAASKPACFVLVGYNARVTLTNPHLEFSNPAYLWAMALALAPAMLAVAGRCRLRAAVLQSLALLLAGLALAGPVVIVPWASDKPLLILTDVSDSTRGQSHDLNLPQGMPVRRATFAADSTATGNVPDPSRSCIAPALQLALTQAREISGVVIHSDGQFSDWASPAWLDLAEAIRQQGLSLAAAPMDSPPQNASVAAMSADRLADGRVEVVATLDAWAQMQRRVTVRSSGGTVLLERDLLLEPGESRTVRCMDQPLTDTPAGPYRVELSPADAWPEDDQAQAMLRALDGRVAVIGFDQALVDAIRACGPVEAVSADSAPQSPQAWGAYRAVVLCDPRGKLLTRPQRESLAQYVRGGGALVLLGSGACEPPTIGDDPLSVILPLTPDPQHRPALNVVLLLDASGSMAQPSASGSRFDDALGATLSLGGMLSGRDSLAVMVFGDSPRLIYDSGSSAIDGATLLVALREVRPSGPTKLLPAMEAAIQRSVRPGPTLVIVVSDLQTQPLDAMAMVGRLKQTGLKLSLVAVGSGAADSSLAQLAHEAEAPLVHRNDLRGLAEVFGQFVSQARGEGLLRGRYELSPSATIWAAPANLPVAAAVIPSALREGAQMLAHADGHAVLARGRAGLGSAVVLALPLEQNPSWANWPDLGAWLWAGVNSLSPDDNDRRLEVHVTDVPGARIVVVQAREQDRPQNLLSMSAESWNVEGPSTMPAAGPIELDQVAPGQYRALLKSSADRQAIAIRNSSGKRLWVGVSGPSAAEIRTLGANRPVLRRLVDAAGGSLVELEGLAQWLRQVQRRQLELWPILAGLALAAMVIDWLLASRRSGATRPHAGRTD